jgi:hypothetical protein
MGPVLAVDLRLGVEVGGGLSDGSVILEQKNLRSLIGGRKEVRTNLSNHVSSSMTPIGRFPLRYSLQYPPRRHR